MVGSPWSSNSLLTFYPCMCTHQYVIFQFESVPCCFILCNMQSLPFSGCGMWELVGWSTYTGGGRPLGWLHAGGKDAYLLAGVYTYSKHVTPPLGGNGLVNNLALYGFNFTDIIFEASTWLVSHYSKFPYPTHLHSLHCSIMKSGNQTSSLPDGTHVKFSPSPQCYSHLTEWGDLEKAALVNVDDSHTPRLERVWEDSYFHVSEIHLEWKGIVLFIYC